MKLSVIIPSYLRAPMLCEAIDSVLSQDIDDMELIVIDDGSTDDTRVRVRQYGDRIRYVYQENQGLSAARNNGIALARGEYIALLDNDDWFMPGKLRLQLALLDALPDVSGTYSNFTIYRSDDDTTPNGVQTWYENPMDWSKVFDRKVPLRKILDDISPAPANTMAYIGSLYSASLEHYFVLPSTAVFRKSMLPEDGLFPVHDPICGDWDFFARISRIAPLCFVDTELAYNRSHIDESRLTQTRMRQQIELRIDFLERVYRKDEKFYKENRVRVDRVHQTRLSELCKLQLLEEDQDAAVETSVRLKRLDVPLGRRERLLIAASAIPGTGHLLSLARALKRRLRL